ncbi:MAG TPA: protein kinase, partial [Burkholderiaceae bacterium]|nr:protein kinase [Burkholderiaceae bacterium]
SMLSTLRQPGSALAVLHDAGWVHCDVAPSNVLVDDVGDVVVLDLGIAERRGAKRDAIMGNAGYVAPDVVALRDVAQPDDVYALGILWAGMAKGDRLFAERDVAEAAVVGRPDPRWGEAVVAVVAPRAGAALSTQQVLGLFEGRLARFKHPKAVLFVDALPRTALGKLRRDEVRQLAAANQQEQTA